LGQRELQIPIKVFRFIFEKAQGKRLVGKIMSIVEKQGTETGQKDSRSNPEEDREKA